MKGIHKALWLLFLPGMLFPQGGTEPTLEEREEVNMEAKDLLNQRLSEDELRIIEFQGTEAPWTGDLLDNHETGTYVCARCQAPLYHSSAKFDSQCGWPSFDDEIEGAVERRTDADGRRTEILCDSCGAHLGHVFIGEGFTEKNTRHCVNSLSMDFIPDRGEVGRAVYAGGCFWGVEYLFAQLDGVLDTTVGYSGGDFPYPTYQDVLSHQTGHYEVIEVLYDPEIISYEALTKYFFEIHDPTQTNGQGPDLGEQYLSVIFPLNLDQRETAQSLIEILEDKGLDIATTLQEPKAFWPAEVYHQDYYLKKGTLPYCHSYTARF